MKRKSDRGTNTTIFLDLLFNFLLGFVMLFIILMAIIKVDSAKPAVEDKNEFIITMNWTSGTDHDLDLWVLGPTGDMVGFAKREGQGLFLQRDDLGMINDQVTVVNGERVVSELNEEIINIRKIIPGRYVVNVHFYRGASGATETAQFKLIKINPFGEVTTVKLEGLTPRGEVTALVFEVLPTGEVVVLPTTPIPFVLANAAFAHGGHP